MTLASSRRVWLLLIGVVAVCGLSPLAVLGLPTILSVLVSYAQTEVARGGIAGVSIVLAMLGVVAYWAWRLARTVSRYGNGQSIRLSEALIPIAGLVAATIMAAFVSATPVGTG